MNLTKEQRLILYNQYEILKVLYPEEAEGYEVSQKVVAEGYKYSYDDILAPGICDETPVEISKFVFDVFTMFRILNNSLKNLKKEERDKIDSNKLVFKGYDGNEETEYYSYACFVIRDLRRYDEFNKQQEFELNSHCAMVETYRKMLIKWEKISPGKYDYLSLEQINKIIDEYW